MKDDSLWQISVTTSEEAEEAVVALLERLFGQSASVFSEEETRNSVVTVFSAKPSERAFAKREALLAGLNYVADCGLNIQPASISISKVPREDWAESWKKYFKTIEVGSRLLIKPSWSKRRPKENEAVVVLDPGLSFGTGQHATTRFCLEQIVACQQSGQPGGFLDIGSGSGILSIAAAKLGYSPVRAFDNDPVAVRIARANARRNRVQDRIKITRSDLTRLSLKSDVQFDLICANLLDSLLIQERRRVVNRLAPAGRLVLAGILSGQFPAVQKAYEAAGLELIESRTDREWRSGAFAFPSYSRAANQRVP